MKPTTEAAVERACCELLHALGYFVLRTTHQVRRCPHCKRFPPAARYGSTPGVPDLLAFHPAWGPERAGFLLGLELKRPGGRLSPAQRELRDAGAVAVVASVDDLLAVLRAVDPARAALVEI